MSQLLRARRLLTGQGWLDDHQLRMDRGVITAIEPIPAGVNTRFARHTLISTSTAARVWM